MMFVIEGLCLSVRRRRREGLYPKQSLMKFREFSLFSDDQGVLSINGGNK